MIIQGDWSAGQMNSIEMMQKLMEAKIGSKLFVSYQAGRQPTLRAKLESEKANYEGYEKRWYVGTLQNVFMNKKGQVCFTILSETRYDLKDLKAESNYRCFNPMVGNLLDLQVLAQ